MRPLALSIGAGALLLLSCAHRGPPPAPARAPVEFTPVAGLEDTHVANPHDYEGRPLCQSCHTRGETGPRVDPISLCAQCHDPAFMKHPWRVEQKGDAGSLPLMDGRQIACHTCHDPHDVKRFPHGLRAEYTALCLNCHKRH